MCIRGVNQRDEKAELAEGKAGRLGLHRSVFFFFLK